VCFNCKGEPEFKDRRLVDCPRCHHALFWEGR
jgi:DNA-directed RNA polymerase subunit RPC12/RpoP